MNKRIYLLCLFFAASLCAQQDDIEDEEPGESDITQLASVPTATVPVAAPTSKANNPITLAMVTNPRQTPDGRSAAKTDDNRYDLPLATQLMTLCSNSNSSYSTTAGLFENYPDANAFFPDSALASDFTNLITELKKDENRLFFVFLKKIHSLVLQDIYAYLKKIFVTFQLTFADQNSSYVSLENTYAFNTKFLVLHHLISLIDANSHLFFQNFYSYISPNGDIKQFNPTVATHIGATMMNNDAVPLEIITMDDVTFGTKISTDPATKKSFLAKRAAIISSFKKYSRFMQSYTAYITKPSQKNNTNALADYLITIKNVSDQWIKGGKTIKPQLVFSSKACVRAINMLPVLGKSIPSSTKNLPWPASIVTYAKQGARPQNKTSGTTMPYPIAFFRDVNGASTQSEQSAVALFTNMPSGNDVYEQEFLKQPSWLNTLDGILNMTRACLGDFSVLVRDDFSVIVDTTTQTLISKLFWDKA